MPAYDLLSTLDGAGASGSCGTPTFSRSAVLTSTSQFPSSIGIPLRRRSASVRHSGSPRHQDFKIARRGRRALDEPDQVLHARRELLARHESRDIDGDEALAAAIVPAANADSAHVVGHRAALNTEQRISTISPSPLPFYPPSGISIPFWNAALVLVVGTPCESKAQPAGISGWPSMKDLAGRNRGCGHIEEPWPSSVRADRNCGSKRCLPTFH
jgi:hypothetical protein